MAGQFKNYCTPRKNVTLARYKFLNCRQEQMSFDQFVTMLRNKAKGCEFGDIEESLIRDLIVTGINDNALREKLLEHEDLDLRTAIRLGQASEATRNNLRTLESNSANPEQASRINTQ